MTDHPPEDAPDGFDELLPEDDQNQPEENLLWSVERVNAMLGRWYRLQLDVDEYDRLHKAEIQRLKDRRDRAVGPVERRINRIRNAVEQFAVRSFLDFGKTSLRVPNGDIESRPVVISIDYDAEKLFKWAVDHGEFDDIIELKPTFDMKKLRAWLEARVEEGHLQRLVVWEGADGPEFELVDEKVGWHNEFLAGQEGVWFWTETGATEYGREEGQMLPGLTWSPKGTLGSGRNFKVKL